MDPPSARDETRGSRTAFEQQLPSLGLGNRDGDGLIGEGITAAFFEAQPHRSIVPIKPEVERGEVALAMAERKPIVLVEGKG